MAALGIGMVWGAYTIGLYGYCLVRGYDVTFGELMSNVWPPPFVRGNTASGKSLPHNPFPENVKK